MITRYFCTHFDINYMPHARCLHKSLTLVYPEAVLFMFCMDEQSYLTLKALNLTNVLLVPFIDLEESIPGLYTAKENRSRIEYFYTCSPATCYYVFKTLEYVNEITYLDADLYFYNNPEPIFTELGDASVGIIEHKFSFFSKRNRIYGNFNVGWITFRRDEAGFKCLEDWMNNCIEWCYQRLEENRYADQKYLDYWQRDYKGVYIIQHKGANLAIWNINNYKLSKRNHQVFVDDELLLFYHFANLKQIDVSSFRTDLSRVFKRLTSVLKNDVYIPYILSLLNYMDKNKVIVAKKDTHATGIGILTRMITREIRQFFFPDIIKIK